MYGKSMSILHCLADTTVTFLTASVLFMATISVDRLLAILYPMQWRLSWPGIYAIVIVTEWLIAIAVAVPMLLVREQIELQWADRKEVWCDERWPRYASYDQPDERGGCRYYYPDRQVYYNCLVGRNRACLFKIHLLLLLDIAYKPKRLNIHCRLKRVTMYLHRFDPINYFKVLGNLTPVVVVVRTK